MSLPEMNNEKMNNAFHYLVMHPIAYLIGIGCAAEQYTPDGRYFGIPAAIACILTMAHYWKVKQGQK